MKTVEWARPMQVSQGMTSVPNPGVKAAPVAPARREGREAVPRWRGERLDAVGRMPNGDPSAITLWGEE